MLARSKAARAKADDAATLAVIRQFQSESDALREASQPRWSRLTVLTLAGFFAAGLVLTFVTRFDRVVTSQSGKVIPVRQVNVLQALDSSIIKSISAREGDEVRPGQVLATLDPTFAAADVKQLQQQIGSLEAQIARDE